MGLTEKERAELDDLFGYVPDPEPLEAMLSAVERIVREHTARALAEVEQRIWAQSSCASLANTGYDDHKGCAVAQSLRIVRAARQASVGNPGQG